MKDAIEWSNNSFRELASSSYEHTYLGTYDSDSCSAAHRALGPRSGSETSLKGRWKDLNEEASVKNVLIQLLVRFHCCAVVSFSQFLPKHVSKIRYAINIVLRVIK